MTPRVLAGIAEGLRDVRGRRARLDVAEELLLAPEPACEGTAHGGHPTDEIKLNHPVEAPGDAEEAIGELESRSDRPAGQGLPTDDHLRLEVDDRLVERADRALAQDRLERGKILRVYVGRAATRRIQPRNAMRVVLGLSWGPVRGQGLSIPVTECERTAISSELARAA